MCYYSTTMRGNFRGAKEHEDLVVSKSLDHAVLRSSTTEEVVCVMDNKDIHLETFDVSEYGRQQLNTNLRLSYLKGHIGRPMSGVFCEYHSAASGRRLGYASDAIMIGGLPFHLLWLKQGTKCYIGPKKADVVTKLGVDDPSIALDHGPQRDDAPTHQTMLAKIDGLCSITR